MPNKQPWYHRCEGALLFTTTEPVTEKECIKALEKALKPFGVVTGSVEFESVDAGDGTLVSGWADPEPGDPSDLM